MYLYKGKACFSRDLVVIGIDPQRHRKLKVINPPHDPTLEELSHEGHQVDTELLTYTPGIKAKQLYARISKSNIVQALSSSPGEDDNWRLAPTDVNSWIEPGWVYSDENHSFQPADLQAVRNLAIERINTAANEYQNKIIGTTNPSRAKRFEANLNAAKAMLSGSATPAQTDMLQMQLDAVQFAQHPVLKDASLSQFAQWIAGYDELTTRAIGLIENMLVIGSAQVKAAESFEQIAAIVSGLAAQAEQQFTQLIASAQG